MNLKNKHPEVFFLYEQIKAISNEEIAKSIVFSVSLPITASIAQKSDWVNFVANQLQQQFDEKTIIKIRQGCYYESTQTCLKKHIDGYECLDKKIYDCTKKWLKSQYEISNNLNDFVNRVNERSLGWYVKDEILHTKFFECECPMVQGIEILSSKVWCYCSTGYSKRLFEDVFDCTVDVELLESIKTGSDICLMKIIPSIPLFEG